MRTGLSRKRWATVDIETYSLSEGTPTCPIALSWTIHGATRSLAGTLGCDVTATDLRASNTHLGESEAIVHELTATTGIDHVTVHEQVTMSPSPSREPVVK